jgi:hypothetical protein
MRRFWIGFSAAVLLALGGASTGTPAVGERADAWEWVERGRPEPILSTYTLVDTQEDDRCITYPAPAGIPVTVGVGEPISRFNTQYRVRSIGVTPNGPENVWLVARVEVDASGCAGWAELWDFFFAAADGSVYPPAPQGRLGEFTAYDIPPGEWATGLIFFDLPRDAVPGGAVGFQALLDPATEGPYGLWSVPASPPAASTPYEYPRRR